LEFYTIQNLLDDYEEYVDRENKEHEKQQRDVDKQQSGALPQMPKINMPKFDVPKINMPSY